MQDKNPKKNGKAEHAASVASTPSVPTPPDAAAPLVTTSAAAPPRLTIDLPAPGIQRWVTRRKAQVVAGVKMGLLSVAEACARYHLTEEELHSWQHLIENHGLRGLRVTRLQQYRHTAAKGAKPPTAGGNPASSKQQRVAETVVAEN